MQAQTPVVDGIDVEQLYQFVIALRGGDFEARLAVPESGRAREVAVHLNRHIQDMGQAVAEVTRVAAEVGTDGRLGPQADVQLGGGAWRDMIEAVNVLAGNVTENVRDLIWTVDAVAKERRYRKVHTNCQGEWLALKAGMNALVERLESVESKPAAPAPQG